MCMVDGQIFQTFSFFFFFSCDAWELMHVMFLCTGTEQASVFEPNKAISADFFLFRVCVRVRLSTLPGLKQFTSLYLFKLELKICKPNCYAALIRVPSLFLLFSLQEKEMGHFLCLLKFSRLFQILFTVTNSVVN